MRDAVSEERIHSGQGMGQPDRHCHTRSASHERPRAGTVNCPPTQPTRVLLVLFSPQDSGDVGGFDRVHTVTELEFRPFLAFWREFPAPLRSLGWK